MGIFCANEEGYVNEVSLSEVQSLHQNCLRTYPHYFKDYWQPSGLIIYLEEQYSITRLQSDILNPDCSYYFIKNEHLTVGFLKINLKPIIDGLEACMELEKIYLFPGENNKGYGGLALRAVEEIAKSLKKQFLVLYVLDSNQPGVAFYQRQGYKQSGTARLDYPEFKRDRRGLFLMVKRIATT